ncbi:MFS transporter [Nostocaceae cyanobacterium CENA357]|uniref:MFS transporter n=1 Tax=Atlanticothrix silvestris CENA357 TaxID=1725252 RepID=A0A8J7L462_9CYAN|nr:MFS transporter [Atlanticothrix silvestris]MBH8551692.1 MFS transporter [Atlanticothrix silvestris CENA357]
MPQKSAALRFVILLGFVSLCADATYEGARSITGAYLQVLGASGTVVGLVAGFGELIGYGLRLFIGYLSDQTGKYWGITTLGYILNTAVVPLLALTGRWETAAGLMMAERTGKAIRTPPRDALLSHGVSQIGRGFGFGLHEAMDQTGAVMGPVAVAAMVYFQGEYRNAFTVLIVPAVLGLIVLLILQFIYPNPSDFEEEIEEDKSDKLPGIFWIYLGAVAIIAAGYADFPLIAFHFQKGGIASGQTIPLFYALAMGVDAIAALIFGYFFDRIGIYILVVAAFVSSLFAPLVFLGDTRLALLGMAFWGIGMGAQESVLKAAIAGMVPKSKRATAYGIFSTGYGLSWFIGSALMGILYDHSLITLIVFSSATQLLAIPFFVWVKLQANNFNRLPEMITNQDIP